MDERTKNLSYFVCSSMVLEKRGTISEEENRLFFSSFCMTKRKIFCPFYFYKMGRWRSRKANRHNPKGIKGESETSPFSSHIVIQERSALYYNVIACSICGIIFSILLGGLQPHRAQSLLQNQ
ncbi:cytochrome B [Lactococcus lactis]|uniref:cytochrome B n=1 Tax=Lactococcus lactis TaxID=1358 RepID=UPI001F0D98DA|nr:cytochrome B [Lactococcus lactis]MCH5425976.1 cytochrome B [Lactococcus lactis]